jgi:uncharacterized protein YndB with AHSA1/START domain
MSDPTSGPAATATVAVRVAAPPPRAFALFTVEIDSWWRRGRKYRHAGDAGDARITLEPHVGGRVFETWTDAEGSHEHELGRVTAYEPPHRLVFGWRNATFAPLEHTEVEVAFAALGSGTLVTVRHRGWEALPSDHPARHGLDDVGFARMLGLWWGELLSALRGRAAS